MNSMTKLLKGFADRFIDFANVGFRYIDVPGYNEKLCSREDNPYPNNKRISA